MNFWHWITTLFHLWNSSEEDAEICKYATPHGSTPSGHHRSKNMFNCLLVFNQFVSAFHSGWHISAGSLCQFGFYVSQPLSYTISHKGNMEGNCTTTIWMKNFWKFTKKIFSVAKKHGNERLGDWLWHCSLITEFRKLQYYLLLEAAFIIMNMYLKCVHDLRMSLHKLFKHTGPLKIKVQ